MRNIIIWILLFHSCNQGSLTENLSGNYIFFDGGGDNRYILYNKELENISNAVDFKCVKANIYSKVVEYVFNDDFILVAQVPNKEKHINEIAFELEDVFQTLNCKILADSLISNDPYFKHIFSSNLNFWIIDVHKEQVLGPFLKNELIVQCKTLKIPLELNIIK